MRRQGWAAVARMAAELAAISDMNAFKRYVRSLTPRELRRVYSPAVNRITETRLALTGRIDHDTPALALVIPKLRTLREALHRQIRR